jgi:hypothetical protein
VLSVTTPVVIERDEEKYPSKGTWPQFRGKRGHVVEVNEDRKRPWLTEYGVVFGDLPKPQYSDGRDKPSYTYGTYNKAVVWFKDYELRIV